MKRAFFILSICFVFVSAQGQTATRATATQIQQSNAEKFSETSGTLIQKEFIDIGKIGATKIQVAIFTDLIDGKKTSAVRFEKATYSSLGSDTKVGILDPDELDGLIKSLHIISDKIFPTTVANYTEVNFTSRGGFSAGCFWSKGKWESFIKVEKYGSESYEFLSKKEEFDTLLSLLEQAKSKLI